MSKLNIEFMDDDMGFCSKVEDDLENSVEELIDQYKNLDMPWGEISREEFEQLYIDRGFLLAWYPFKKNSELLEIGAGLGAITGMLCQKAGKVFAVEKKKKRAEIIKKRFADLDNLEIVQENYMNLPYKRKFDYIVVHDIFGYVKKYIKSDKPYEKFFDHLLSMLKDDGTILLATENRLGMKYFSGAIEDYSNKFFVGLDNFDGYDVIYTPTKKELLALLEQCGLFNYKFYYPFPDNIFPTEIFTDNSLAYLLYGGKSEETGWDRFELYNERELFESLQREGIVQIFANAFLIEVSRQDNLTQLDYCKLITSKANGSFKYTSITGDEYSDSNNRKHFLESGSISLHRKLSDLLNKARHAGTFADQYCKQIYDCFKKVKEWIETKGDDISYIYTEDFITNFGDAKIQNTGKCVNFCSISTKNIFVKGNSFQIFLEDNEYMVPTDFLVWSIVYEWYINNIWERKSRMKLVSLKNLYGICELREENVKVFQVWWNNYRSKLSLGQVEKHYVDWYKQDFIYPVDAIVNGDLIRRDFSKNESEDNQMMVEKAVLDEMR